MKFLTLVLGLASGASIAYASRFTSSAKEQDILSNHRYAVTHELISKQNDSQREMPYFRELNYQRSRAILQAFYLETNMHSEVFSKYEALLLRLIQWIDSKQDGFSMNSLHELMALCRRAADDFEKLRDYRRQEGVGQQDEPIALIAVIPAVVATLAVPQRVEIIRQLTTIAPRHRETIEQFSEYLRIFVSKPWKRLEDKEFKKPMESKLGIREMIERAKHGIVRCNRKQRVTDVDQVRQGLEAALEAALFLGPCSNKTSDVDPLIEEFSEKAASLAIPKVELEAIRPLSALRHELFNYTANLPEYTKPLVQLVTREVNEKRSLEHIAESLLDRIDHRDRLLLPVLLAPLALVTDLNQVLELDTLCMPTSPSAFRLLLAAMFASLQGGNDYFKLSEQIDHDQAMYPKPKAGHSAVFAVNLNRYYGSAQGIRELGFAEQEHEEVISTSLRKGFKALAWSSSLKSKTDPVVMALAKEAKGFDSKEYKKPQKHAVDFWHALVRYTLPAKIPFASMEIASGAHQPSFGETSRARSGQTGKEPFGKYSLKVTWGAISKGLNSLSRSDQLLAYENIKVALACTSPQCTIDDLNGRYEGAVLMQLLGEESFGTDRVTLLESLLSDQKTVSILKARLMRPEDSQSSSKSFPEIAETLQLPPSIALKEYDEFIESILAKTRDERPSDYLKAAGVLQADVHAGSLKGTRHLPAACLLTFIQSNEKLRDQLLVASALECDMSSLCLPAIKAFTPSVPQSVVTQVQNDLLIQKRPLTQKLAMKQIKFDRRKYHGGKFMRRVKQEIVRKALGNVQ